MTYSALESLIIDDYRVNRRRSIRTLESARLPHLRAYFNTRGVDLSTIRGYIRYRLDEHAAAASINRELAGLRRMHTLAGLPGPRVAMLQESPPREGFVSHNDFLSIRAQLPEHLRDAVYFLFLSSWRLSEMTGLTWQEVHLSAPRNFRAPDESEGCAAQTSRSSQGAGPCPAAHRAGDEIRLSASRSKNGRARVLPLRGELRAIILRALAARNPHTDCVFHWRHRPLNDVRRAWKSACDRAGVPGLLIHDLRRSAIRNFVRAGVRESVAMALSGHQTRSVFDRYNITDNADLVSAVEAVTCAPTDLS
jgi:integrase